MQFALLVYESPEAFATRNDETGSYIGAWRACPSGEFTIFRLVFAKRILFDIRF
jgi:hypothetical protein